MKDGVDIVFMFFLDFAIDDNIIQIDNVEFVNVSMQNIIYPPLESIQCIK